MDICQPFDLGRRFDLVMSLEVAEHVAEEHADTVIDSICRHGDVVMFSAAIPHQGGVHHVNEQPYDYWRAKFAARGYAVFDCARRPLAGLREIEPWYRFNTFVYANNDGQSRLSQAALDDAVADWVPLRVPLRWRMGCFVRSRVEQGVALFRVKRRTYRHSVMRPRLCRCRSTTFAEFRRRANVVTIPAGRNGVRTATLVAGRPCTAKK